MPETTTFKARNNHVVTVDAHLWELAQSLVALRRAGRMDVSDACALLEAVDLTGDLDDQKRTLRHIRHYFRWTGPGGQALTGLMSRTGALKWTPEGVAAAVAEVKAGPARAGLRGRSGTG